MKKNNYFQYSETEDLKSSIGTLHIDTFNVFMKEEWFDLVGLGFMAYQPLQVIYIKSIFIHGISTIVGYSILNPFLYM